jgi:hypothetical protein
MPQKNFCGEWSAVFLEEAWVGGTWASELISCGQCIGKKEVYPILKLICLSDRNFILTNVVKDYQKKNLLKNCQQTIV